MEKNIAVVGSGYWGKNLVRNFSELGALHTICDTNPETLKTFAHQYPSVNMETQYSKVLADKKIKGVVIATPAIYHYPMAKEALLAGKDILVEKPLSLKVEEGQDLINIAQEKSLVLQVSHLLEYHPAVTRLKELVDKGELGKIEYIYSNRLNLGKIRTEENILWSFAPHDISAILLMLGGEMPEEVAAHGAYYLNQDIADVTLSTLAFKDGVKAHIFVSWLHPFKEQKLVIIGTKKMAAFNDTAAENKLVQYSHHVEWVGRKPVPAPGQAESIEFSPEEPLKLECQDFIKCLKTRSKPVVDGKKGLKVLAVLAALQESLEQNGKVVKINPQTAGYFVHDSSIVEMPCEIGNGTKVWHYSHIMPEVTMGNNCVVGQNVFIAKGVQVGNNVKIENNVSIFQGVTLEDDVFCGPSCVFTNVINPRSHISKKHEFKETLVKKGATIGANSTIVCGTTINEFAFIGAGSVVTKDVPEYALVYGNPAVNKGWMCHCGEKLVFPKSGTKARCSKCGTSYKKENNKGKINLKRM